jgi:hypothetical protein
MKIQTRWNWSSIGWIHHVLRDEEHLEIYFAANIGE